MARGPLFQDGYRPQLSGHETFPLRYGWLKKAFDAVADANDKSMDGKQVFLAEDAIARFGAGKNMVASMRHWVVAAGILDESQGLSHIRPTALGEMLFGPKGLDRYMEHPTTSWLVHWNLAACPAKTTWFWAFNHYPAVTFDRDQLHKGLLRLAKDRAWRASAATIKNDVACFVRTYVASPPSDDIGNDDALESPLTELGLVSMVGKRDGYRFVRGPKATLGDGVFTYALVDFWSGYSRSATTLSLEAIAHEPGSPGRVLLLEENDIADRLVAVEKVTKGGIKWSETAGLKQMVRQNNFDFDARLKYVEADYSRRNKRKAA